MKINCAELPLMYCNCRSVFDFHPEVVSACCSIETGFLNPIPSSQDLGGVVVLHIFALLLRSLFCCVL